MTPPEHATRLLTALAALLLAASAWSADPRAAAGTPAAAPASQPRQAPVKVAQAKVEAKPTWAELTPAQQQALAPLTGSWAKLSEAHKRKWLAVSQNYPTMPPGEQARLHTRMAEWAALTPQQRVQARRNYFEAQSVPDTDRKAKWEAYQALPAEEKRKLAAGATKPSAPATAAAVQPAQQKLATVPKPKKTDVRSPRIAVAPGAAAAGAAPAPAPGIIPAPGAAPVPAAAVAPSAPAESNSFVPDPPAVPGARPYQP